MDSAYVEDARALRDAFLSAPVVENGWDAALRLLARTTRGSRGQIVGFGDDTALFNEMTDAQDGYEQDFLAIEAYRPEVNWRVAVSGRPLEVLHEDHYDAVRAVGRFDAYDEHVHRWGGTYGCQTVLMQDSGQLIGLATLRQESDGRTSRRDRALFAVGAEAALAAVRMQQAIADQGRTLLLGSLDAMNATVFLLDARGHVVGMSEKAQAFLSSGQGVLELRRKQLSARRRDYDRAFQAAVAQALRGETPDGLWIGGATGMGALCEIFRLPVRAMDLAFQPRVMVTLRDAAPVPDMHRDALRQALGLTVAEAEIALALANGTARDIVARDRGTSSQTLNTQVKSILHKGGVNREPELLALINRILR